MSIEFLTTLRDRVLRSSRDDRASCIVPERRIHGSWSLSHFGLVHRQMLGEGSPVLVVPGLWGGSDVQKPLIEELARSHRVHWFDWPGDGRSVGANGHRNVFEPGTILKETIEAIGEKNLTIYAHSFGAMVALRSYLTRPMPTVANLIVTGAGLCETSRVGGALLRQMLRHERFDFSDPLVSAFVRISLGTSGADSATLSRTLVALTRTSPSALAARARWMAEARETWISGELPMPVTMIVGERDSQVPLHSQSRLAEAIPAEVETIAGAGHFGMLTHARDYADAIASVTPSRRLVERTGARWA